MRYVLCHGFGFTHRYWEPLLPYLEGNYDFFDEDFKPNPNQMYIGIGHSLGFLKLNQSGLKMKALIGLQGFLNFCSHSPILRQVLQKNLERMIRMCIQDPQKTLKFFYKQCGYPLSVPGNMDKAALLADLNYMKLVFKPCGVPTCILGSPEDPVVSKALLEDNFKPPIVLKFIAGVNHTLGFSKPKETFECIQQFLAQLP